jgi:two-component system cell cycle response regulator
MGVAIRVPGTRWPPLVRATFMAAFVWMAIYELRTVLAPNIALGGMEVFFSRYAHDVVLLAASGLCLAGAMRRRGAERVAWLLIGAGVSAWSLGEVYYTGVLWTESDPPIPSPADIGYLLFPPLALAGAIVLLRVRARGVPRRRWLDGITAALSVSAVSAAIVFQTVHDHVDGDPLSVATALAYPLWDLLLLGLFIGALAGTGWRLDRVWILLAMGVATFWLADSLYLVRTAEAIYESGGWFDAGWWAGLVLIAAAAWSDPPEASRSPADESLRAIAVPIGFGLIGLALLVSSALSGVNALAVGLAAASLLAVMGRTVVVLDDNVRMLRTSRDEALTDSLTGLGNRRALTRALDERVAELTPDRPMVLALFDLDGFKQYNDTFGHPAGDALLVRLGSSLAGFMAGRGDVFRMGGDEFCALFEAGPEGITPTVEGAALALSEHGEGFSVGCSYGAITLPGEAHDVASALRRADQRMYANKHGGRVSAGRQTTDALLRALAERDPHLAAQAEAVELAVATARALSLPPDEQERVRHATELRDIGKVAVPDAILSKPGPLRAEEWAFVRRHPVIGERIIDGAPALQRVGKLVRLSHERWDGTGYPDRLVGDEIPLAARIVAVADAFAAMTVRRPYRPARTPDEAIDELRACAGSQFDPAVVEAFVTARAHRSLTAVS